MVIKELPEKVSVSHDIIRINFEMEEVQQMTRSDEVTGARIAT